MPDSVDNRPLWCTGTHAIAAELKRRAGEGQAVQRAFLQECDLTLLLAEVVVRGYSVQPPMVKMEDATALYDAQAQTWVGPLGKRWPVEGGDDVG